MLLGAKGTYGGDADQPEVLLEAKGTYGGGATGGEAAMAAPATLTPMAVYPSNLEGGFKSDSIEALSAARCVEHIVAYDQVSESICAFLSHANLNGHPRRAWAQGQARLLQTSLQI